MHWIFCHTHKQYLKKRDNSHNQQHIEALRPSWSFVWLKKRLKKSSPILPGLVNITSSKENQKIQQKNNTIKQYNTKHYGFTRLKFPRDNHLISINFLCLVFWNYHFLINIFFFFSAMYKKHSLWMVFLPNKGIYKLNLTHTFIQINESWD